MLRESLQGIGNICVTNYTFEFHSGFSFGANPSSPASSFEDWQTSFRLKMCLPTATSHLWILAPPGLIPFIVFMGFLTPLKSEKYDLNRNHMPWVLWRQLRSCYSPLNPSLTNRWSLWTSLHPNQWFSPPCPRRPGLHDQLLLSLLETTAKQSSLFGPCQYYFNLSPASLCRVTHISLPFPLTISIDGKPFSFVLITCNRLNSPRRLSIATLSYVSWSLKCKFLYRKALLFFFYLLYGK